ncbi:MAG: hypothetical protein PHD88_03730 [Firmicutes bacterium]|nr:hypothetical protein [Bacillota bacterium]MDD4262890.1 hypothetical protein [Bacillota bacterium]MDD4693501.1 hypothetical protein [Bacillota bacterium]
MRKGSLFLVVSLVLVMATCSVGAASLAARVVLPDGSGAPFATITIGDKVFTASESGRVELTYDTEKTACVKWLELEEEIPISDTMTFSNKLYYGAPYDVYDFLTTGPEIWEVTETAMFCPGGQGNESQIYLDDSFENFVFRSKFNAEADGQWNYLRFMLRGIEPGFNGYGLSVAIHPIDECFFARFNGSWDAYDQLTESLFVGPSMDSGADNEFVAFLKDEHIVIYIRNQGEKDYTKLIDLVDEDPSAFFDGGVGILNSFTTVEITEFSVFRY